MRKEKKTTNVLSVFFISHKSDVKNFFNKILNQCLKDTRQHDIIFDTRVDQVMVMGWHNIYFCLGLFPSILDGTVMDRNIDYQVVVTNRYGLTIIIIIIIIIIIVIVIVCVLLKSYACNCILQLYAKMIQVLVLGKC